MLFRRTRAFHKGSVLPSVRATRTRGGYRLDIDRSGAGDAIAIAALVALLAFVVYALVHDIRNDFDAATAIQLAIAVPVLLATIFAIGRFLHLRRASLLVRRWPIRLGDEVEAEMHAHLKRDAIAVAARLECVEIAQTQAGTRMQTTHDRTIFALDVAPEQWEAKKRVVTASWRFTVPAEMPPSFDAVGNKVCWRFAATVAAEGVDVPVSFDLVVVPELAS